MRPDRALIPSFLRRLFLVAGLTLASLPVAAQDIGELQVVAFAAVNAGDDETAVAVARQILLEDPKNALAEFVLTVVAMRHGALNEARTHGRLAFRFADPGQQKFQAAMIQADLANQQKRPFALRFWLRQAADQAPAAPQRDAVLKVLAEEKAKAPVRVTLSFSLAPSSNVNNGASSPYNIIDGILPIGVISAEGQSLSGWEGTAKVGLASTIAETDRSRTELTAGLTLYRVALSGAAKAKAPGLSASELGDTVLKFGLRHTVLTADGHGKTVLALDLGRGWAGTGSTRDLAEISLSQLRDLGQGQGLSYGFSLAWMAPDRATRSDTRRLTLSASYSRPLANGDLVFTELSLSDTAAGPGSDRGARLTRSAMLRLGWQKAAQVGPFSLGASVGINYSDYPDYALGFISIPGGRQDISGFAEVTLGAPDLSWAGFKPTISLRLLRTDSNVSAFTTRDASVGLGLVSEF